MPEQDLPDPLVPAEVNLEGLAFMPMLHLKVMQSDMFAKSTGDEFKAAFALWCSSWTQVPAGSLPDDDEVLEYLSRSKVWKKVRDRALYGWVRCSDGRLYHPVIAPLAIDAWERRTDYREVQETKDSRQQRWRESIKRLSELLRKAGITPPARAKKAELERLCRLHVDGYVDGEASTQPSTVDAGETAKTVEETVDTHRTVSRDGDGVDGDGGDVDTRRGDGDRTVKPSATSTAAGAICKALKAAGIQRVNSGHPVLQNLIAAGATAEELVGYAEAAKTKGEPFAWLLTTAVNTRKQAAAATAGMRAGPLKAANGNGGSAWEGAI